MPTGILGKKIGMTQVFTDEGRLVGVTVIQAGPCPVLSVAEKSIQLGFEPVKKPGRLKKPAAGYFEKIKVPAQKLIRQVDAEPGQEYKVGQELTVDMFKAGDLVDVTGVSKGKGFQGGVKRWNWKGGPMTHGSMSHRRPGSIGSTTTPGRVWKGHHMPGHMGDQRLTVQNLRVIKTDAQNHLLLVEGAVAGHNDGYLVIRKAVKKKAQHKNKYG